MSFVRLVIKMPLFLFLLLVYSIFALIIFFLSGCSFDQARPKLTKIISLTGKYGLKIIGVKVDLKILNNNLNDHFLIVCNHLSYLDVLIISQFIPSSFVTSKEMKRTPFLGQLCSLGGCLFVDRQNRKNISDEVQELTRALKNGLNVTIFPEATSTNGQCLIRFRRPLFQAAINSKSKVLPLVLNYKTIDGENISLKNRDIVCWYDDMTFLSHAIKLFAKKKVEVELMVLPAIDSTEFYEKSILAEKTFEVISHHYIKII